MRLSPVDFQYNLDIQGHVYIPQGSTLGDTQAIFEQTGMLMQNNAASRGLCPESKTAVSQQQQLVQ